MFTTFLKFDKGLGLGLDPRPRPFLRSSRSRPGLEDNKTARGKSPVELWGTKSPSPKAKAFCKYFAFYNIF